MDRHVHFIGIGGIGVSALAQLYQRDGATVTGSDRATSPVTELLCSKDIVVHIGHGADQVPDTATLVVYSDAVPFDNPERVRARELGIPECSYFEALGEVTKQGTSIVVTGTHGKTTTTAMLAHILIDAGKRPTVIAGSILSEYGSNFVAGAPDLFVIEGCEYRRHFLHLHPHLLVITNIELDHTDYYRDLADVEHAFIELGRLVPQDGAIIAGVGSQSVQRVLGAVGHPQVVSYRDIAIPSLRTPGTFNQSNARAAKAAARAFDSSLQDIELDRALSAFRGTWRRFEYKGETERGIPVYDDYAHHPTAVSETLALVREAFPGRYVLLVFHPHLYSRTRDLGAAFVTALAHADEVIVAPIYAAREAPIPDVSSDALAEQVCHQSVVAHACGTLDETYAFLTKRARDLATSSIIITMGAGDIYQLADRLVQRVPAND